MTDPRIQLKNPWLAGILGFLIPGAGHLYQGRLFKAAIYSFCILGLFFTGMAMAGWQAVQPPRDLNIGRQNGTAVLKFVAQAGVGLPAVVGLVQRERYLSENNVQAAEINRAVILPFTGNVDLRDEREPISGTLYLEPTAGQFGGKAITGRLEAVYQREPVSWQLGSSVELGKPVDASRERGVVATIVKDDQGRQRPIGRLSGTVPRKFWNWFEVPLDDVQETALHRRLGKLHELAMVFTWVAGLLNILAVWDAIEGPAYGYGDEEPAAADPPPTPA